MTVAEDEFSQLGDLMPATLAEVASREAAAEGGSAEAAAAASGRLQRPDASGSPDAARDVALAWPQVVGREAAANSQPVRLRQGRLVVAASSSAWAQTLQFMEETIKARLCEIPGLPPIERVQFRHAGWEERRREERGWEEREVPRTAPAGTEVERLSDRGLSAEQKQALEEVRSLGLDPALEEKITRAMKAAFVRSERGSAR